MSALCLLISVVLFVLAAFGVHSGSVDLGWLGGAFLAAAFLVGQLPALRGAP